MPTRLIKNVTTVLLVSLLVVPSGLWAQRSQLGEAFAKAARHVDPPPPTPVVRQADNLNTIPNPSSHAVASTTQWSGPAFDNNQALARQQSDALEASRRQSDKLQNDQIAAENRRNDEAFRQQQVDNQTRQDNQARENTRVHEERQQAQETRRQNDEALENQRQEATRIEKEQQDAARFEQSKQNPTTATTKEGIYEFPDAKNPGKTYVGQSSNTPVRMSDHRASGKLDSSIEPTVTPISGGKTAREVAEQKRINELGGVSSQPGSQASNKRNPIGKAREKKIEDEYGPLKK